MSLLDVPIIPGPLGGSEKRTGRDEAKSQDGWERQPLGQRERMQHVLSQGPPQRRSLLPDAHHDKPWASSGTSSRGKSGRGQGQPGRQPPLSAWSGPGFSTSWEFPHPGQNPSLLGCSKGQRPLPSILLSLARWWNTPDLPGGSRREQPCQPSTHLP